MTEAPPRPSRLGPRLPAFYCPLERDAVHPEAKRIEARAVAWLDDFGLYPDPVERAWGLATHSADFSCRIIPRGDTEALLLFVEWNYWANAVDDWQDSGAAEVSAAAVTEHGARLLRTIENPDAALLPDGPATRALRDLVERTHALLTPHELRRFVEGTRDWLLGAAWQATQAEQRTMPGLNDFAALGALANGTRFSLTWSDVAGGIRLPPDVLHAPALQALTDAAGFVVSADNDLFSYDKDDHVEPREVNLVNVIAHREQCAPAEAVPLAVALRDRVMSLFVRLRAQLAAEADAATVGDGQLARHLEGLGHYVAGSIAWQTRAPRYASPRNRHALPLAEARFDIRYADRPSDPGTGPPPLPAIAGWWSHLRT
ncbi:terpene synthase family protein [Streptomyces sp. RerS4]|uniref:terpene synthase family protein n=1 Tax=Streptomyces sp. RerS4 TaxID=2942449 RepID=UPI00201BC017|nr:terpene synthase family protein [Streptomyces sp. RerS4]UQW99521.1 terpene synthase family protein [Streptomyces sp. RerS4]